ncbi:hypothetical protein BC628DRAFT_1334480 [Trametes gibbosa]|nr:hypothetical protein BC628DRAFT_1334480 [Trametes gibbosa]
MEFTLNVTVDTGILPTLKKAGYKLCIAKKVNGVYSTIWHGNNVLYKNKFVWSSKYQVFGSNEFKSGALYGVLGSAYGTPNASGKFSVQNKYGLINIGMNSYINGTYTPSYVSPSPFVAGTITLEPIETVMVWFDTNVTTGTMMLNASSLAIEVDFTGIPTHSLVYKVPEGSQPGAGVWILDGGKALLPMTYSMLSNSFSIPEPHHTTLALITESLNTAPGGGVRPGPTAVVATAEYADAKSAARFADYIMFFQPDGFSQWDVSRTDSAVSVCMKARVATDEETSVRTASDHYLEALYGFGGPKFKTVRLTAEGGPANSGQLGIPVPSTGAVDGKGDASTGTAVVRFEDQEAAIEFAEQLNGATSPGASLVATVRDIAVHVQIEAKGTEDTARKRARLAYDAAVAAYQDVPAHSPPVYVGSITWGECQWVDRPRRTLTPSRTGQ